MSLSQPVTAVTARSGDGELMGGATGHSHWQWLFVRHLWVNEPSRRRGIGTQVMDAVEKLARTRTCVGVHLDTYGFQAEAFYLAIGYARFGSLDDYPPGHARIFLMKRLS